MVGAASARADEGVLPLAMPSDVHTVWVADPGLAVRLESAGYRLVEDGPDVVVVRDGDDLRRAPQAPRFVAVVDGVRGERPDGGRLRDAVERLRAHGRMRWELRSLRRVAASRGAPVNYLHLWDGKAALFFDEPAPAVPFWSSQRYLRRALLAGGRSGPTLLHQALRDAAEAVEGPGAGSLSLHRVVLSEGSVVALCDLGVLRVGLGAGRGQVDRPAGALRALRAVVPGTVLEPLVPELLAAGQADPLSWSLEQRMEGVRATPPLSGALMESCIDVLVALRRLPASDLTPARQAEELAEVVAPLSGRPDLVRALAAQAEQRVSPLRAGVQHGDFWWENLLLHEGRLHGVVDWDSAASNAPPFLDLLHLTTVAAIRPGADAWGQAFTGHLLPWCAAGGDGHLHRYAAETGVDPSPDTLWAASVVYWLAHVSYQVSRYAQRLQDPAWLRKNLDVVADELARVGPGGPNRW